MKRYIQKNKNVRQKGITLIVLVITIVVMLILAGTTIGMTFSDRGVIKQTKRARFSAEAMEIKDELERSDLLTEIQEKQYAVGDIDDLELQLEEEKKAMEQAKTNAADLIRLIQTAEGGLSETYSILQRMHALQIEYSNTEELSEESKASITSEMGQLVQAIDDIAQTVMFSDIKLLDGTLNITANLGNEYYSYGDFNVSVSDCGFKSIYGAEEFDYADKNEKVSEAMAKISNIRSTLGAKQNALEHIISDEDELVERMDSLIKSIFYDADGQKLTEQEAIKNVKSNNISIRIMEMAYGVSGQIYSILQRIKKLAVSAWNTGNTDANRQFLQTEINELLKEIDRELNNTTILNKNLFQGDIQYIRRTTLNSLGIKDLSVINKAESQSTKVENAMSKVNSIREKLIEEANKLEAKKDEEANENTGLEIEVIPGLFELNEKYKNKFKVINRELIYVGTNEDEKEWAKDLDIKVY